MKYTFFAALAFTAASSCVVYPQKYAGDGVEVVQLIGVPDPSSAVFAFDPKSLKIGHGQPEEIQRALHARLVSQGVGGKNHDLGAGVTN